ncbi:MAG: hypothetical protein KAT79_07080 [candidate division Zixibacteria bacterium]|nr:hypothetical protein [candidate division Zixibacteria bacterium]
MKRFVIALVVLALAVPGLQARKPKKKAGTVEGTTYTDAKYDFSLNLVDGWKYKVNKDKDNYRLVLTQKNFQVPPDYQDAPDYTKVPRMVVYADTSSMKPMPFLDSLLSDNYSSKQKKALMKEFEIFQDNTDNRKRIVPRKKKVVTINDKRGVLWTAQGKYTNYVSLSSSSTGGGEKRVYGAYGGAVVVVMNDDIMVAFHLISEWQYFPEVLGQAMEVINSLKWPDEEEKK